MVRRCLLPALITLCVSLVLGFAGCELVARALAPSWLQQRVSALVAANTDEGEFGNDRGWKVERRNGEFVSFSPRQHFDILSVEYRNVANIDELGGRRTSAREDFRYPRVVMFGDSFTFGVGVEDMETFASRIAAKIADHRFINLGVPGTALPQQLEILRKRYSHLHAKLLVFFFFLGNDFADILQASRSESQSAQSKLLSTVNDDICHHPWLEYSYATQFVCSALPISASATRPWFEFPRDPAFYVMDRNMGDYQELAAAALAVQLRALAVMQKILDFKSLIVVIPDVHQVSETARKVRAEQYGVPLSQLDSLHPNELLENEARKAGLLVWDPTACLVASVPEPSTLYYKQDNHFRNLGHEAFAECVTPRISKLLMDE